MADLLPVGQSFQSLLNVFTVNHFLSTEGTRVRLRSEFKASRAILLLKIASSSSSSFFFFFVRGIQSILKALSH